MTPRASWASGKEHPVSYGCRLLPAKELAALLTGVFLQGTGRKSHTDQKNNQTRKAGPTQRNSRRRPIADAGMDDVKTVHFGFTHLKWL